MFIVMNTFTAKEALEAIEARTQGVWDHPQLLKLGELHTDESQDIERIKAMTRRQVKIVLGQMEVPCPENGKPSYKWIAAWKIVDAETGKDVIQPYDRKRSEAIATAKQSDFEIVSVEGR